MVATWQRQGHFEAPAKGQLKKALQSLIATSGCMVNDQGSRVPAFGNRSRLKTVRITFLVATRQEAQTKSVDFAIEINTNTHATSRHCFRYALKSAQQSDL